MDQMAEGYAEGKEGAGHSRVKGHIGHIQEVESHGEEEVNEPDYSVFTAEELLAIGTYEDEAALIQSLINQQVPIWHLIPVERLDLDPVELDKAMQDPERMPLSTYEEDEVALPLLKDLRESRGGWIESEIDKRSNGLTLPN